MRYKYTAWEVGSRKATEVEIEAESAWKASEQFAEDYGDHDVYEQHGVHIGVKTPLDQELSFNVERVTYMTACPLEEEDERFPSSKPNWRDVKCSHCKAKPNHPCTLPSGKVIKRVHQKRVIAAHSPR